MDKILFGDSLVVVLVPVAVDSQNLLTLFVDRDDVRVSDFIRIREDAGEIVVDVNLVKDVLALDLRGRLDASDLVFLFLAIRRQFSEDGFGSLTFL